MREEPNADAVPADSGCDYPETIDAGVDSLRANLREGGPPVDYEALHLYVAGKLAQQEARIVRGQLVTWEVWNQAYRDIIAAPGQQDD